ncbi:MAG TPA: AMP-binding protein [Stellaceae bacterium]|nr:AMP-binding protein [Stellaceae bacterium]
MAGKYDLDLEPCAANYQPLTPLTFLLRSADVFPDRVAVIHGNRRFTWREHAERCRRLAGALMAAGVEPGDTVAVLAPNTPAMLEAHFGVPMAGAVLNNINIRLDAAGVAFILEHGDARVFLVDRQFAPVAREALSRLGRKPLVIDIDDPEAGDGGSAGTIEYEAFIAAGDPGAPIRWPKSEWDAIALNYTSGTTGNPKGAVYHHRGAYLNSLSQILSFGMTDHPVYLWTLPLFHCNGWCFSWAVAALGGTHVCLRRVAADLVYDAIDRLGVSHFCAAPTVLGILIEGRPKGWTAQRPVRLMTAGAAPPAAILRQIRAIGFEPLHVYGMTEMHGVTTLCQWQDEWDLLPEEDKIGRMLRQGVRCIVQEEQIVADPATFAEVAHDGKTMGEVLMRGNMAMKGYLKNKKATEDAFAGGWYHSGDLAVVHPDGYVEIKDRSKDIIISGGENISSIEVENVLCDHPAVKEAAVVAISDERWGEVPCAIVELKPGAAGIDADAIVAFCRERLAHFKCPRHVIFEPLARTATGKVQKFRLRQIALEHLARR